MKISDLPSWAIPIIVDASKVVHWDLTIRLSHEALDLLVSIVGPTPDVRYIKGLQDINVETEKWGWFPFYHHDDNVKTIGGKKQIVLWFRESSHAVYFKTLWGGA